MNIGETIVSESGGSVRTVCGIRPQKNDAGRIHIRVALGDDRITTVTNHRESERYHRTLFRNLRRLLVDNDAWPYGDEGAETEDRG